MTPVRIRRMRSGGAPTGPGAWRPATPGDLLREIYARRGEDWSETGLRLCGLAPFQSLLGIGPAVDLLFETIQAV